MSALTKAKETYFRKRVVGFCVKNNWRWCSMTGNKSWPDLLIVPPHRRPFWVELKREKNGRYKERPFQTVMKDWLNDNGHTSLLIDPDDDWEKLLLSHGFFPR